MSNKKVLIAEDDPISLRVAEAMLTKWGFEPVPARDGMEALEALDSEDAPQLAILDWMMPRKDGLEVCREVRKRVGRPYVYIILLTAKTQRSDVIEGLGSGADDYLNKPFNRDELHARIVAGQRILSVQRELVEAREALRAQAIRDSLTGLFNRRYLNEALERELRRAEYGEEPLSLLMLDLDHFKQFNDAHGHQAGDTLLKQLGALMETRTRREDVPCRYGGEEFVLILPGAPLAVGLRRADELLRAIREMPIEYNGTTYPPVTASIGLACFPEHGNTPDSLLRAADDALYRAKSAGRDRALASERQAGVETGLEQGAPANSSDRH